MRDESREERALPDNPSALNRRRFLQLSGGALALIAAGCSDDNDALTRSPDAGFDGGRDSSLPDSGFDAGNAPDAGTDADAAADAAGESPLTLDFSDDFGVMNFAYILEQIEAAFFAAVVDSAFDEAISAPSAQQTLHAIATHAAIHRGFFAEFLGDKALDAVQIDLSRVEFDAREALLDAAQRWQDLSVAAYNGAALTLREPRYLMSFAKIVSVKARQSAAIRSLYTPKNKFFGGTQRSNYVINNDGLDRSLAPADAVVGMQSYLKTPLTLINSASPG